MTRKKIIIYSVTLVLVVLTGVILANTFRKKKVNSDNPEFAKYISAYTSGVISKSAPIQVSLTSEMLETIEKNGSTLPSNLFDFRPSVDGKYTLNGATIEFIPEKQLISGETYLVEFHLDKLTKVQSELEDFVFEFKTIIQSFDFSVEEQKTIDKQTLKYQQVLGIVQTADSETTENIQKVFSATQNGKGLSIKWTTDVDGVSHYFTIDSIQRLQEASTVLLKYDGDAIKVDKKDEYLIDIPAINDFKFINAKVIQQPEQYLKIQFSDPLDESQDLKGLISIKGENDVKYILEDNIIKVFPAARIDSVKDVTISNGIKNILGVKLQKSEIFSAAFEEIKPGVRLIGEGSILPSSDKGMVFPFEAVNLKAVDVTIIKIYEKNILQFLQVNELEGANELMRVGKPVLKKTVQLDNSKFSDLGTWNRYSLDLNKLIQADPGAIYRITIGFRKYQSAFNCSNSTLTEDDESAEKEEDWSGNDQTEASNWNYYNESYDDYYGYYGDDYWTNRDNPCSKAYYGSQRSISRNIIASDIGIIAKQGNNGALKIFVTDLLTAKPKEGATVEIYDYQNQLLKSVLSDKNGMADPGVIENPFFAVAKVGKQSGYLKLADGSALSLSRFDISGTAVSKGLKGFIYGERGVWRPGDSIFLTFILKEDAMPLPKDHPIVFELKNTQSQTIKKEVVKKNETGFYTFKTKTDQEAITGDYSFIVSVGSVIFSKTLKIETIKPNRLKINLDFGKKLIQEGSTLNAVLNVKWLHGAIGKDLKVSIDATLKPVKTEFSKYSDYSFDDPTKEFYAESERVFEGSTDQSGNVTVDAQLSAKDKAPGKLAASFVTKVFEKGGNFSLDQYIIPYSPYESYIGLRLPKGDKMRGMLLTDTTHTVELVTLNPDGTPFKTSHKIEMKFYKISWRWWWDEGSNSESSYNFTYSSKILDTKVITSSGGKATWKIKVKYPEWGRYLVYAKDLESGHSTGKVVYIDWPGWAGRSTEGSSEGATMLMFSSEKSKYNVGEEAKITIPSSEGGRALVCIENGTQVLESYWVETKNGETPFTFKVTEKMSPNVYVNVTLLQPHAQTANDLPIRMFGVISISVEDPKTHLNPVISMPDKLEAEQTFAVKVSEKDNKSMTYTIAVVDEGLLDLTRFKTPDPWESFFAKEALGVKTWDLFNQVIGAYNGKLDKLLAIGGDADVDRDGAGKKANRFQPVVMYLGPFTLSSGSRTHNIKMPKYIGSVRTMVIAGTATSYGKAEKSTPVIKPLMVMGTLPRVLSPGEKVKLPVSIFAMESNIKTVKIQVKTNNLIKIVGQNSKTVKFSEMGEENSEFDLEVLNESGIGKVEITATSGNKSATFEIELDVRNPNQKSTDVIAKVLSNGENWATEFKPIGMEGTNTCMLEVSSIPPINLEKRLDYLMTYPYGCVEQTTSSVFPQLYVSELIDLNDQKKKEIETNIKAGIKRLQTFQTSNGGLSYWQGSSDISSWGTTYAGHFLIEAEKKGYAVPVSLLKNWRKYQTQKSKNWIDEGESSQLEQAYRLYTLALAGDPEKGSMNRLKEKKLSIAAKWRLAAAYILSGNKATAEKLVVGIGTEVPKYTELSYTFGNDNRDEAMILETLTLLGKKAKAFEIVKLISENLSSNDYLSTQTTAYSLLAVAKYVKDNAKNSGLKYSYSIDGGKTETVSTNKTISLSPIKISGTTARNLKFNNTSGNIVYARIILQGIPPVGNSTDAQNNLNVSITYKLTDGTTLSPDEIPQGTDFIAEVVISHPGGLRPYKEMALSQIFPSGWEIINTRMVSLGYSGTVSVPTYQDIRDDRVNTFFDLPVNTAKTFRVLLNASYAGEYWMAPTYCSAMYDPTIFSRKGGKYVKVVAN